MYALLVLYFCSQSVKDLIFAPLFWKASAKVRPFSELAKQFIIFFQEKQEKRTDWTKRRGKRRGKGYSCMHFEVKFANNPPLLRNNRGLLKKDLEMFGSSTHYYLSLQTKGFLVCPCDI